MVFQTLIVSNGNDYSVEYQKEDWLFVIFDEKIDLRKDEFLPFCFFSRYSKRYPVRVAICADVIVENFDQSYIFVFENGELACVATSVEEGATSRKIYKRLGLSVGEDFRCPLNYALMFGDAEYILSLSTRKIKKEDVKTMQAYRYFDRINTVFGFVDGFYLSSGVLQSITCGRRYETESIRVTEKNKNVFAKICIVD